MKAEGMTDQAHSITNSFLLVVDKHRTNRIMLLRYLAKLAYAELVAIYPLGDRTLLVVLWAC